MSQPSSFTLSMCKNHRAVQFDSKVHATTIDGRTLCGVLLPPDGETSRTWHGGRGSVLTEHGCEACRVLMASEGDGDRWLIVDEAGNTYSGDDEGGWTDEYEAARQARAYESRGEGRFRVVRSDEV